MSQRVYLTKNDAESHKQEDTPVSMRIQLSNTTAKALQTHLQDAYHKDEVRLVWRITVLLDLLVHHVPVSVVCERWRLSPSCLYAWQKAFLVRGMDSLRYRHSGGRPESRPPARKNAWWS